MAERMTTAPDPASHPTLIRAAEVAREADVQQSVNGLSFATYGETGVTAPDLDHMLGAVPVTITAALKSSTWFFVPLALREPDTLNGSPRSQRAASDNAMVAPAYTDDLGDAAICHRNVELPGGHRGVFISTRLMTDRFALCFEFFINVAHALVDAVGVPQSFMDFAWQQALENVKGETSMDAWEARHLSLGIQPAAPEVPQAARNRRATKPAGAPPPPAAPQRINEKEKTIFLETAFSDAVAIYLLSLALDFDYAELRERDYPLLAPAALAARLRLVAELFPPNPGYEFAVRYRRRA